MFEHTLVRLDQGEPLVGLQHLRRVKLLFTPGAGQFEFGSGELLGGVRRKQRDMAQLKQLRLAFAHLAQCRSHPPHPLEADAFGFKAPVMVAQQVASVFEFLHLGNGLQPVLGAHGGGFQCCLGPGQIVAGDVVGPITGASARPELVSLGFELIAHGAQTADASG